MCICWQSVGRTLRELARHFEEGDTEVCVAVGPAMKDVEVPLITVTEFWGDGPPEIIEKDDDSVRIQEVSEL